MKAYRKFLHQQTGVLSNKPVKDFSSDEFERLWRAIEKMEGYVEGSIVEIFP